MKGERPRIIDVMRKPRKCPVCGGRVWDIIYGTGDMTEIEFFLQYRREAMMGGDKIPRRPPIWACACGCKRFRKVNADGTDIPVKPKMLKNIRKKPLGIIEFTSEKAHEAIAEGQHERIRHYKVTFTTEYGEKDTMSISAVSKKTHLWGQAPKLSAGARPRDQILVLGPGPEIKYLLETYCWGQAPK